MTQAAHMETAVKNCLISALSLEGCVVLIGTHIEYPFDPLDHK